MNFVFSTGKQKYTLPIYRALMNGSDDTKDLAKEMFKETKYMLHVTVAQYVEKIIDPEDTS